jgi:hypothetical protein
MLATGVCGCPTPPDSADACAARSFQFANTTVTALRRRVTTSHIQAMRNRARKDETIGVPPAGYEM